jgi:hypothetical protein
MSNEYSEKRKKKQEDDKAEIGKDEHQIEKLGYQPSDGGVDRDDPPQGGSGVPSKTDKDKKDEDEE